MAGAGASQFSQFGGGAPAQAYSRASNYSSALGSSSFGTNPLNPHAMVAGVNPSSADSFGARAAPSTVNNVFAQTVTAASTTTTSQFSFSQHGSTSKAATVSSAAAAPFLAAEGPTSSAVGAPAPAPAPPPTITASPTAALLLLADTREKRSFARTDLDSRAEARALAVGDLCWVWRDENGIDDEFLAPPIVERKTVPDLDSSIRDGRYSEQKLRLMRLMNSASGIQVYYLVESSRRDEFWELKGRGNNKSQWGGLPHSTICSALAHTQLISGVRILRTQGPVHTLELMQAMEQELSKTRVSTTLNYATFAETAQKSINLRNRELLGKMLRHIDKCGEEAVEQLVTEFRGWGDLVARLPGKTDAEWLKKLKANLEAQNKKPRAINKNVLGKLRQFCVAGSSSAGGGEAGGASGSGASAGAVVSSGGAASSMPG